ncbi:MAG: Xaa-Pro peptidase family protein [Candidatus Nanoarchaeia archaeon]|nr:Xaa-Pro peptidase family protein [Candidatus Nanoarchaeia archaeon]
MTLVLYGTSSNSDLYYASGFSCFDSFVFLQDNKSKVIITSVMEKGRALKESKATSVYSAEEILGKRGPLEDALLKYVRMKHINTIEVPLDFPIRIGKKLRLHSFVNIKGPELGRECKSLDELNKIKEVQDATASAMNIAKEMISRSLIGCEGVLHYNSMALTSEWVKREISIELARHGCYAEQEPIVVCGDSCLDVHNTGKGALKANESIIIDIFPRSSTTRYFSDMTRTFVKGKAPAGLKKMYEIVKKMKQYCIFTMKPKENLYGLYMECKTAFEENGFKTSAENGKMQGFIHGLGHGVGLDIHESPHGIEPMKAGNIIAIEPGLYYKGTGGVRLEDIVHILPDGCENLTHFPEELEL